jgi:tetrahydromethanopterin S-methyltransferase subunit G
MPDRFTDEELENLIQRVSERVLDNFYQQIGRQVVSHFLRVIGIVACAIAVWFAGGKLQFWKLP